MSTLLSIPCCVKGLCDDPSNPFANLTAEGPDSDYFIGLYHGSLQQPPPLDWTWGTPGCLSFCTSTVSQADADLCAQRQQVQCTTQNCNDPSCGGNGGDGGWLAPGRLANPPVFTNTDQPCTTNCPDGLPFTYTLPAGSVAGINQAYCNQQAQSIACNRAAENMMCLSDLTPNTATVGMPYVGIIAVNGGVAPYSLMILAGSVPPGITATIGARFITLSGTPTTAGTYSFTVDVNDSSGLFMTKNYTITVLAPPCVDWTKLTIDPGSPILNPNSGAATFNPASGGIQTFTASVTAPVAQIGASSVLCNATVHGYNGPACNCNLQLTWTKVGTNFSAGFDVAQVTVTAGAGGTNANFNGTTANGVYNFPFSVDSGLVTPYDIDVTISVSATVFLGQLEDVTLTLAGVFTNV